MFENIVTENELDFNILEKKMYSFICELGCNLLSTMLENYDQKIMEARDKKTFRHKGYRVNSIKTVMGLVSYKRAIYEYKDDNGNKKFICLLDSILSVATIGKMSANLVEKILSIVVETTSYRDASSQLIEGINQTISHEGVRNVVIKEGYKIIFKEQEEYKNNEDGKLIPGTKEIPVLFEEADGLWINLQGNDRKKQIEKYKRNCEKQGKEYKEPNHVKSELKLHIAYEGWKKDDPRHSLVDKMYIVGFMSAKEIRQRRDAKIYQKYNLDKIKVRVMNGDGALWIDNLATGDTIRQKDNFHIHQEIIRDIPDEEYRRQIERLIAESRYNEIPVYINFLKYEYGGEEKVVKKLEKLESYLSSGLERYREVLEKQNRTLPEAPEGIEYKEPGIMESQIFTVLSKRFKSGRLSFSKIGATCLAKICAIKVENKGVIEIDKLESALQIEDDMIKYMKEIKKEIEEMVEFYLNKKKTEANDEEINKNPVLKALGCLSKKDTDKMQKYL